MKISFLVLCLFFSVALLGQYDADAIRLSKMEYMKYADRINCEGEDASSLEQRVCLNLEFQKVDAALNTKFNRLCLTFEQDSIKKQMIDYHEKWIDYRRLQSKLASEGYRGHLLGIVYLDCMVQMTKRRIEDIEYLLRDE